MGLGNPLWAITGILLMALLCGLLAKRFSIMDELASAHAKTLPIDGLRGILASAVLFHHAIITYGFFQTGLWAYSSFNFYDQLGPTAVTMFFFISGYLFWRKMLKDPSSIATRKLVPNRARRIMPAYLAATLLFFITVAFISDFKLREPLVDVIKEAVHWIFLGYPYLNGTPLNTVGSLDLTGGIFWTLQFEWIFYLSLPLLTWARSVWKVLLCFGLAAATTRVLAYSPAFGGFWGNVIPSFQRFAHMFFAGFAIGMLAAHGTGGVRISRVLRSPWMSLPAIALIAVQFFLVPAGYSWFEPVALAPIFFMIVAGNSFLGLLTSWPLRALGTVSYSIYVFHALLLHILTATINHFHPIRFMRPSLYWLGVICVALVVTAWSTLSYRFIEKPFLSRRT